MVAFLTLCELKSGFSYLLSKIRLRARAIRLFFKPDDKI